jgi:hypothetical protein
VEIKPRLRWDFRPDPANALIGILAATEVLYSTALGGVRAPDGRDTPATEKNMSHPSEASKVPQSFAIN